VLVVLMRRIYDIRHLDVLGWHDIYIQMFMKVHVSVQAILRLYLWNFKGCNVGISDWWDL
jgi:hypothetical protein